MPIEDIFSNDFPHDRGRNIVDAITKRYSNLIPKHQEIIKSTLIDFDSAWDARDVKKFNLICDKIDLFLK
jgi:hypothetical protein